MKLTKQPEKKYRPSLTLADLQSLLTLIDLTDLTTLDQVLADNLRQVTKTLKLFLVKADLDGVGAAYVTKERALNPLEILKQETQVSKEELIIQYNLAKSLGVSPTKEQEDAYNESQANQANQSSNDK